MAKLALHGGQPVRSKPFPSWPQWDATEEKALMEVLDEGVWGTLGPRAMEFASKFAAYVNTEHAICVNSGTVALEIILRAMGIGHGDEVIVPAYTFAATISAVAMVGAIPVLADIERDTCNITADEIEKRITERTRAVIIVHFAGRPCDMDPIMELAKQRGIFVIEDASHAHGAEYKGTKVGGIGHAAAFSCQRSKNLTCGEGGLILTNDYAIHSECWHYHHSGRALEGSSEFGGLTLMGTNSRMAEWQACILDIQLDRLDAQNEKRRENAALLTELLSPLPLILPPDDERIAHVYHLYHMRLENAEKRDLIIKAMNAEGIPVYTGYTYGSKLGFIQSCCENLPELPITELAVAGNIWLHGSALLGDKSDMQQIADAFCKVFENMDKGGENE